jgi:radical SAM protein with 4Fe4S-binding SPASM domain
MLDESADRNMLQRCGDSAFKCAAGKYSFWLNWTGKLTPCVLLTEPYTEPLKVGFQKAWESLVNLSRQVPGCEECDKCKYKLQCMACPGRLKIETGFFDKPAPYLCQLAASRAALDIPFQAASIN